MRLFLTLLILLLPFLGTAQTPEKQISFAREHKTHAYYVQQARLWWKEVQKNDTAQVAWYNYYRACRNAQGTADWKEDFVKEDTASLRLGHQIVELMRKHIPGTFTCHFVAGSTGGVNPAAGADLLKAYAMNPNFEGINADVVTYAQVTHDRALRQRANRNWHKLNELSPGLMAYGYNLLQSAEPNGILLTQHDNDSYPVWMLQDALGIRDGVTVINIDFLLEEGYRKRMFDSLGLPPMVFEHNLDSYGSEWQAVVQHILKNHKGNRPLYVSRTLTPALYRGFEKKLATTGLAMRLGPPEKDQKQRNLKLVEKVFLLDYFRHPLNYDLNLGRVNEQNANYLPCLKLAYDQCKATKQPAKAGQIKALAQLIVKNSGDDPLIHQFR